MARIQYEEVTEEYDAYEGTIAYEDEPIRDYELSIDALGNYKYFRSDSGKISRTELEQLARDNGYSLVSRKHFGLYDEY